MKNKKIMLWIFLAIGLTIAFFSYPVTITYDSSHYLWLTSLLTHEGSFADWDVARGPIFPLFIKICNSVFGHNSIGLLIGMYMCYLAMIVVCIMIYKDVLGDKKKFKYIFSVLFIILIVLNPIVFGYYHTLLTEFIGMTFAVLSCFLSWKWMIINFKENKLKYISITILFSLLATIAWLLKQPYVGTVLFPIIIAAIVSFVRNPKFKNLAQRVLTLIVCCVTLVIGVSVWNYVVNVNNVNIKQDRTSEGFLAAGILNGITEFELESNEKFDTVEKIYNNANLKNTDKEKMKEILEGTSKYKNYRVYKDKAGNFYILYGKNDNFSTTESMKFLLSSFFKNPKDILGGYITNYLATISVYETEFEGMKINIKKSINFKDTQEVSVIGFRIYGYNNDNVFPLSEEYDKYVTDYKSINKPITCINYIMRKAELPNTIIMKVSYLILPIVAFISIIKLFAFRKRYCEKCLRIIDMELILYLYSLMHILVHSTLGSTIDRYTVPALITTIIGFILNGYEIFYRKSFKINNR
ncbi:MAG: hypothetical protein IKE01_00690 [Clostridia bacterium]|nr:hypothetical protein [Clostridia bacterium]